MRHNPFELQSYEPFLKKFLNKEKLSEAEIHNLIFNTSDCVVLNNIFLEYKEDILKNYFLRKALVKNINTQSHLLDAVCLNFSNKSENCSDLEIIAVHRNVTEDILRKIINIDLAFAKSLAMSNAKLPESFFFELDDYDKTEPTKMMIAYAISMREPCSKELLSYSLKYVQEFKGTPVSVYFLNAICRNKSFDIKIAIKLVEKSYPVKISQEVLNNQCDEDKSLFYKNIHLF